MTSPSGIVIFSPNAQQRSGHNHDYVSGIAARFSERGLDVRLVAWPGPRPVIVAGRKVAVEVSPGRSSGVGSGSMLAAARNKLRRLREQPALLGIAATVAERTAYPVLFESYEYLTLSVYLRRFRTTSSAVILHNASFVNRGEPWLRTLYRTSVSRAARSVVEQADQVFVHGPALRDVLIHDLGLHGPEMRVAAIPYGVSRAAATVPVTDARRRLGLPKSCLVLFVFGTLRQDKAYRPLLEALSHREQWHLLVAGSEGDLRFDRVAAWASEAGVRDRTHLHPGFIDDAELPTFFAASDVVACLYHSGARHASGGFHAARSHGTPVIASGPPDLRDEIRRAGVGWVMEDATPATVGDALDAAARAVIPRMDEGLRERLHQAARVDTWDDVADRMLSLWLGD